MASKKILTYTDVNGNGEYRVLFYSGRVNPYHIYRIEITAAGEKVRRLMAAYADMASVFCWFFQHNMHLESSNFIMRGGDTE